MGQRRDTTADLDRMVLLRNYQPTPGGPARPLGDCLYAELDIQVKCPNRNCRLMTWMSALQESMKPPNCCCIWSISLSALCLCDGVGGLVLGWLPCSQPLDKDAPF